MEFFVRYGDGEERWVTWSKDLFDTVQYEDFCRARGPLFPLLFTTKEAKTQIARINNSAISEVEPGDTVYVDLRSRGGATWYNDIGLPDAHTHVYALECVYGRWIGRQKRKIMLHCAVTHEEYSVDHYFVFAYGHCRQLRSHDMILVDAALCAKYPTILPQ